MPMIKQINVSQIMEMINTDGELIQAHSFTVNTRENKDFVFSISQKDLGVKLGKSDSTSLNPILVKFSNDKEISIILQKKDLVVAKTQLDITDEVIKIVNSKVKEFKINK